MANYWLTQWEKFFFIITPAELETVLTDMHLLITSRHVPLGYRETPLQEYIAGYEEIYGKLSSGRQVVISDIWGFVEVGIAGSLEKHSYGNLHTYCDAQYLSADFEEPCVMLKHFPLHFQQSRDGKSTLTTAASSIQFPEKTVGLTLFFPKQICYVDNDENPVYRSTKELASYQDYLMIRNRIKAITKPLRLISGEKEIRPRVRISPDALEHIDAFWFLQTNHVRAIK